MLPAIFTICCHILLYFRSGSALRIAEVDKYSAAKCPAKKKGAATCLDVACCKKEAKEDAAALASACVSKAVSAKKFYSVSAGYCNTYEACTAKPTAGCGEDKTVNVVFEPGNKIKADGDPHVVNMAGEKFDILATGAFSLLSLTRATEENLMINGTIARFGAKCGESFITDLEHTGGWIRKAYNTEALKVRAVQDTPKKEALQINLGQKWEPLSHLQEMAHISKTRDAIQLDFSSVTVQVSAGKHWRHGWNFLNLDVQGLASLDENIRVGGLLGYDDHTQVLQADADCAMFAETTETDTQIQQYCLSYLNAS